MLRRSLPEEMLQIPPRWQRGSLNVVAVMILCGIVGSLILRLDRVVVGPGIVQVEGEIHVDAPKDGVVDQVAVVPGEGVEGGEILVRMSNVSDSGFAVFGDLTRG